MANTFSTEAQLLQNQPVVMPNGSYAGGRVRRYRNSITLASQASADTISCQPIPAGHVFCFGILITDTSLGTATIAIGNSTTAAKYRAAAVFTATGTPTLFGITAANALDFSTATEIPLITVGTAALPSSGLLVVDFYFSGQ